MKKLVFLAALLLIACGGGSSDDGGNSGGTLPDEPFAMCSGVQKAAGGYTAQVYVVDDNKDVVQIEWSVYKNQNVYAGPDTVDVVQAKLNMTFEIFMEVDLAGGGLGYAFYFTAIDKRGHRSDDASWSVWVD